MSSIGKRLHSPFADLSARSIIKQKWTFLAMLPTLAWIVAALVWGQLLRSSTSPGLLAKPPEEEKATAWRWLAASIAMMVFGTIAQAVMALDRRGSLPFDVPLPSLSTADQWFFAIAGDWLLTPMLWCFCDWNRQWRKILASGDTMGYSPQGMARLFRVVVGSAVAVNFAMVIVSARSAFHST